MSKQSIPDPIRPQALRTALDRRLRLGREQLTQRRLRSLDAARQHRLPSKERADQHIGVGQSSTLAIEAPEEPGRLRKGDRQRGHLFQLRGQRIWMGKQWGQICRFHLIGDGLAERSLLGAF